MRGLPSIYIQWNSSILHTTLLHGFELNNIHSEMEYICKSVGIVLYIFYADGSIIYVSK